MTYKDKIKQRMLFISHALVTNPTAKIYQGGICLGRPKRIDPDRGEFQWDWTGDLYNKNWLWSPKGRDGLRELESMRVQMSVVVLPEIPPVTGNQKG